MRREEGQQPAAARRELHLLIPAGQTTHLLGIFWKYREANGTYTNPANLG